jgi:hypothetical protein
MSEPLDPVSREPAADAPVPAAVGYATPGGAVVAPPSSPLLKVGGGLGIAASVIGLLALILACAGFNKALYLGVVVVVMSAAGLVVALAGAFTQKHLIGEDTHVLQAMFTNAIGLLGGFLEMAIAFGWPLFYK